MYGVHRTQYQRAGATRSKGFQRGSVASQLRVGMALIWLEQELNPLTDAYGDLLARIDQRMREKLALRDQLRDGGEASQARMALLDREIAGLERIKNARRDEYGQLIDSASDMLDIEDPALRQRTAEHLTVMFADKAAEVGRIELGLALHDLQAEISGTDSTLREFSSWIEQQLNELDAGRPFAELGSAEQQKYRQLEQAGQQITQALRQLGKRPGLLPPIPHNLQEFAAGFVENYGGDSASISRLFGSQAYIT